MARCSRQPPNWGSNRGAKHPTASFAEVTDAAQRSPCIRASFPWCERARAAKVVSATLNQGAPMDVTIIGTGNMARGIATRVLAGGHSVTLLGTAAAKAEALAAELDGDVHAGQTGDPLSG